MIITYTNQNKTDRSKNQCSRRHRNHHVPKRPAAKYFPHQSIKKLEAEEYFRLNDLQQYLGKFLSHALSVLSLIRISKDLNPHIPILIGRKQFDSARLKLSFTVICMLFLFGFQVKAAPDTLALQIEMKQALEEEGLTGAVWSIVTGDGSFTFDSAGSADAATGQRMLPDSRVQVGSVAKVLLAAGVLRLVTEGKLSLDTPVSELLPSIKLENPWSSSAGDHVRVRHLLNQTSGLDNSRLWQIFSLKPRADTPLVEAFPENSTLLRVRSRPGSRYSYSNLGYALLGMIIESVTGERYESYLDKHLLQPLSMQDSTFRFVSQTGENADSRLAMGHFENGVTQPAVPIYLRSAAQFTTTAADMARFAIFLMNAGTIDGKPFIEASLVQALGPPAGTEAALAGLSIGHGLALAQRDRHGVLGSCHPGTTIGFLAMFCIYPEQGKAFFVAMNTDSETADYDRFNKLLIRALDVQPSAPVAMESAPDKSISEWQGIYVPSPNPMAPFVWIDTVFNFVTVRWDGSRLRVKPFQSGERTLIPVGGMLFKATDRTIASHVLLRSSDGARVLSDGLHSYEQVSLTKMVLLWMSLIAGLSGLAYIFVMGLGRAVTASMGRESRLFYPFLSIIALFIPVPFFLQQSFLRLGDVTPASVLLAVVTGLLPLVMAIGLVVGVRRRAYGVMGVLDISAMVGVLQWLIVLAVWGLLPLRLWN